MKKLFGYGIISPEEFRKLTIDIAAGKIKPNPDDPKLCFESYKALFYYLMRLARNKIIQVVQFLFYHFYCFIYRFYMHSPFYKALICLAYTKYEETDMYKIRAIELGPQFARDSFFEYEDYRLFIGLMTKKEKIKAFFMPYNYIRDDIF